MWQTIGHSRAVSFLQRSLERKRLGHAYLMVGPPHVGKMTLALDVARALNCEAGEPPCGECESCVKISSGKHADVQVIGLNGANSTEISIEQIREMQSSSSLPPFEGRFKVFIIEEAEFLSLEAANCLLKTLEEPVGRVMFILLTTNERLLLATVVSRCQRLELTPLKTAEVEAALCRRGVDPPEAKLLARLCHGCPGWAMLAASDGSLLRQRGERLERLFDIIDGDYELRFTGAGELATEFSHSRKSVQATLDLWLDWWRDLMLVKTGCRDAVVSIDFEAELTERAKGYSLAQIKSVITGILATGERLRQNVNSRLALEVLMLSIPKKEGRGEASLATQS